MSAKKLHTNGQQKSNTGAGRFPKTNHEKQAIVLKKLLADAFDWYADQAELPDPATAKRDFIFHMTDWTVDLGNLAALYRHPEVCKRKDAREAIFAFLVHAVGHLNAASRLLLGKVYDPFLPKKK